MEARNAEKYTDMAAGGRNNILRQQARRDLLTDRAERFERLHGGEPTIILRIGQRYGDL
jgi:hypothetical protein